MHLRNFLSKQAHLKIIISKTSCGIAQLILFLIKGIRPLLGPASCNYEVTCTKFAQRELETKPLFIALWRITKRVTSCNPFMPPQKNLE